MTKPILVIWKEGRDLNRHRQLSFSNIVEANEFAETQLCPKGSPYKIYKLVLEVK